MKISEYTSYKTPFPVGVKLPEIKIEKKYYEEVSCSDLEGNFQFLRKLCFKKLKERGIDEKDNASTYYDRLKEELDIFNDLGFVDYVLLNWDIINFCSENDIPVGAGRGSAAGSLVLYVIGVTNIDPIEYDLFFERFVSKSRARKIEHNGEIFLDGSLLADVDNDISYDRRAEVIKYIEKKYDGKTSKILTLNTLSGKLCMKECGKIVEELSEMDVNQISDTIPKHFGKVASLDVAYEESEAFKNYADKYKKAFSIAKKIEGLNKNTGVHPSGISISFYELDDIMPLQLTNDGALVSGYDMNDVASLSVKFDILGLRTLSVVNDVCKELNINVDDIDPHHKSIYAALACLESPQGLFQIEAETNYKVCHLIKPKNLEQLSAVVAIARPGALDFKDDYAAYARTGAFQSVHEFFDDILSYTGGIPLYQEQLMKMAVKVGFSLDESEQLRRIVGKKKIDQMPAWKAKIQEKVKDNNLDPKVGDVLWKVAEDSANYSFNKSHSISYAYLSAITIYLKFNYPEQFFLSLLKYTKFEPNSHEEIAKISQELPHFDIELLPPDLNKSDIDFKVEGKNIRYGLNSIKGVSDKVLISLLEFREDSFKNKYEVFISAKQAGLNIGVLSALVQAGLLDSFVSSNRCRLVLEAQTFNILTDREKRNFITLGEKYNFDILNSIKDVIKNELIGDDNRKIMAEKRFQTFKKKYDPYRSIYEMNKRHIKYANWFFEEKLLGYSYSHTIRDVHAHERDFQSALSIKRLEERSPIKFVGFVTDMIKRTSRNGNKYARLQIQDESGMVNALFLDSNREQKFTDFLNSGKKLPKKGDITIIHGVTGDDVVFVNKIFPISDKIYMKLSEVK
jgi:DNA polymerase-3 subunit alpha|tara:strand:+ start:7946 stop:10501 length:2556 start_codon:yes stop_codon:yes gene_type:complete